MAGQKKAVHHYAAINYPKLAARFSEIAAAFVPGSIGENLSASGIDESRVAIGDIFALGSRSPSTVPAAQPMLEDRHTLRPRRRRQYISTAVTRDDIAAYSRRNVKAGSGRDQQRENVLVCGVVGIDQDGDAGDARSDLLEDAKQFRS